MTVKLETRAMPKRNPFSVAKIQNLMERSQDKDLYEDLETRIDPTKTLPTQKLISDAINSLRNRCNGTYATKDFGGVEFVAFELLDINIDNQRDVDWDHVAHIIESFDPRAVQVVNTIKLPNGRYSIPEGQHTAVALYILWKAGMIEKDFTVACKVIDALASLK